VRFSALKEVVFSQLTLKGEAMRTWLSAVLLTIVVASGTHAQMLLQEGFESGATPTLPAGWGVWNAAPFPIQDSTNWTVRDTGLALPGLATATSKSHSGLRAIGVSWWTGIDTNTGSYLQADAWLITPRLVNIQAGDSLIFWASGGSTSYLDSLQVWIGDVDSTPAGQVFQIASIVWPVGSVYGQFSRYGYDLSVAASLSIWIGFRYNQNVAVDGFFVHLDDVSVGDSPTSVKQIQSGTPDRFSLSQNYPNPFNPGTKIEFSVPRLEYVSMKVYDALGKEVATLVAGDLAPGTYTAEWNAEGLPSGVYFCQMRSGAFLETRKVMLLK
jgi:hypothetical protein